MSSPSNTSDSIAYLTCIGLGIFATVAQEPAQAEPVRLDGDSHRLSLDNAQLNQPLAPPTPTAVTDVSDQFSAHIPGLDQVSEAPQLAPIAGATVETMLPALDPLEALASIPDSSITSNLAYRDEGSSADAGSPALGSPTPALGFQNFDPIAPFAFQTLLADAALPHQPEADLPQRPANGPEAHAETNQLAENARYGNRAPAYQAIATPPPIPVVVIAEPTPNTRREHIDREHIDREPGLGPTAAPQPGSAFNAADSFTYLQAGLSGRPDLEGIEVIEAVPSEAIDIAQTDIARPDIVQTDALPAEPAEPSLIQAPRIQAPHIQAPRIQTPGDQAPDAVAQVLETTPASGSAADLVNPNRAITDPIVKFQAAFLFQDDDLSARGRLTGIYPITSYLLVGGSLDITEGDAFVDSELEGVNINELYVTVAPPSVPNLRFTLGQVDLTSYFDRNSFAKDAVTHFFNPIFQTNPALATSGVGSRQGIVANWAATDDIRLAVSGFSSDRSISDFELDAVAAELGVRVGNAIIRGTYVNAQDAGADDGPADIFSLDRGGGEFGLLEGDREEAFGVNAEYFIPEINLGLFARFGHYNNLDADFDADTISGGFNVLDVITDRDRLGLAYGQSLLGGDGDEVDNSDSLELFYDFPIRRNFRVGFTLQQRDDFSETIAGFRIRSDFDILP